MPKCQHQPRRNAKGFFFAEGFYFKPLKAFFAKGFFPLRASSQNNIVAQREDGRCAGLTRSRKKTPPVTGITSGVRDFGKWGKPKFLPKL